MMGRSGSIVIVIVLIRRFFLGKCYMKANLTKYHTADSNWEFAVLNTANSTSS